MPRPVIIVYERRDGASCQMYQPSAKETLYETLTRLRRNGVRFAEAWEVDDAGIRIDIVGGIEETDGCDDARIKYQVWAETETETISSTAR